MLKRNYINQNKNQKGKKAFFKNARKVILGIFIFLIVATFLFILVVGIKIYKPTKELILEGNKISQQVKKEDFFPKPPTIVKDGSGNVMKVLTHSQSIYISYKDINPLIINALIQTEDKRFYIHHGVDLYSVSRGIYSILRRRRIEGGSTITQQLVKNIILKDQTQVANRKIKEMVIAQNLEKKFSKKEILEFYLNDTNFGHGNIGIGTASQYYFSKDQKDLQLPEIATLVAIVNNPNVFNPQSNLKATKFRRDLVLKNLKVANKISKDQYQKAVRTPINLKIKNFIYNNDISQNYALNFAINNATEELMRTQGFLFKYEFKTDDEQKEYNRLYSNKYENARQQILNGGYTINTSIQPEIQNKVESLVQNSFNGYTYRDHNQKLDPQVASTVIDNRTGNVLAIVGGRSHENDNLNRAYQSFRQPGSAAKPLLAYPEAFMRGYTPNSKILDSEIVANGHKILNWYNCVSNKPVSLRTAMEQSLNTVAYKLANEDYSNKDVFYKVLAKMHFSGINPADNNPIISIGGFTQGVTTTEMASGYSALTRNGNFITPTNLNSIEDSYHHRIIYQNDHNIVPIFSPAASYMTLNVMQGVLTAKNATGTKAKLSNYQYTAGKTGTTDDNKDSYFVGVTPKFTIATWVGADMPTVLSQDILDLPQLVFKNVGNYLVNRLNQKNEDFKVPKSVIKAGQNLTEIPQKKGTNISVTLKNEEEARKNQEETQNNQRISKLKYSDLYHSTNFQERKLEKKILDLIADFKNKLLNFHSLTNYSKYLSNLQDIQKINMKTKEIASKIYFNNQIIKLNQELEIKRQWIKLDNQRKDEATFEQKKAQIILKRQEKINDQLSKLHKQYQDQLNIVTKDYNNDDPNKEKEELKLLNLINDIRSYGGYIDNPTIVVKTE